MQRCNVLVSAYACNPYATELSYPGEAILGWNLVKQITQNHDAWVITRSYNRDALEEMKKTGAISHVNFIYVSLPRFFSPLLKQYLGFSLYYFFWQVRAFFTARKLCRRQSFDLFHHITFANDWMPSYIGAFLPIPFVWGPIGGGHKLPASLMSQLGLRYRIKEHVREAGKWIWRKDIARKRCVLRAKKILVCNHETEKIMSRVSQKVTIFPVTGIFPLDNGDKTSLKNRRDGSFKIIFAGRLDPIKGLKLGIRAFHEFSRHVPGAIFEIVGSGEEEADLKRMVEKMELEQKVVFTPWLPHEALMRKFLESDVLLFPSLRDGGGAVVVEAMAVGIPVVCLDIAGPGFNVRGEWGVKIPPGRPDQVVKGMADALQRLYNDRELRLKMGIAGRDRVRTFYLWDRLGDRLERIYGEALLSDLPCTGNSA